MYQSNALKQSRRLHEKAIVEWDFVFIISDFHESQIVLKTADICYNIQFVHTHSVREYCEDKKKFASFQNHSPAFARRWQNH